MRGVFFFFQAEDGIRDIGVTGVQTCAIPILCGRWMMRWSMPRKGTVWVEQVGEAPLLCVAGSPEYAGRREIGRASCRERVEISVVAVGVKKKEERAEKKRS